MIKYADYDQVWLVKSAGLVLGPFSFIELTQALRERQVAILDEIRSPTSRWGFVREHPQLAEIVKLVRESDSRQSGKTSLTNADGEDFDLTETISHAALLETTPRPDSKLDFQEATQLVTPDRNKKSIPGRPNIFVVPKPMGAPEPAMENRAKRWPLFIGAITFAAILGYGSWSYVNQRKITATISQNELLDLARRYKQLGFYEKSLSFFQRVIQAGSQDPNLKIEMFPLFLQNPAFLEKSLALGKELLLDSNLGPESQSKVQNWQAMGLMKKGLYTPADELLKKSWDSRLNTRAAGTNLVINKYLLGQSEDVFSSAEEQKALGNTHPLLSITKALSIIGAFKESPVLSKINAVIDELQSSLLHSRDLTSESLLLIAALQERGGASEASLQSIDRLLNKTAGNSKYFIRELDVFFDVVSWARLAPICDQLSQRFSQVVQGPALAAYCNVEQNQLAQAEALLNGAGARFATDSRIGDLNAVILKQKGKTREAILAVQTSSTRVADLLVAQICLEEKNMSCFEGKIHEVLEADHDDPEAHLEMAKYYSIRNKRDLASQEIELAFRQAPNYRPVLEFKEEFGGF